MNTFILRSATLAGVSQVAHVHQTVRLEVYAGIIPDKHIHATFETLMGEYRHFISSGGFCKVVIAIDKIVGICTAGPCSDSNISARSEIYVLYILSLCKRQGIGKSVLEAGLEYLRKEQLGSVLIACCKKNLQAQGFYRSQGGRYLRDRVSDFTHYTVCSECYLFD